MNVVITLSTILFLIVGLWMITQSFIMKTKNFVSSIYFKVIPFFLGLACLVMFAKILEFWKQ
jgi:hypothetical protein